MAFFFAIAMGLARIYLGLHYFSDVLGAVVTGGIGGLLGWTLSGIIPSVYYEVEDLRTLIPGSARKGKHER